MKLRAACLGVKIRAESGLEKALDSLSLFMRKWSPAPAEEHGEAVNESASTLLHMATPSSTFDHVSTGKGVPVPKHLGRGQGEILAAGESKLSVVDKVGKSLMSGGESAEIGKDASEEKMVLREMPNGLTVWWGSRAEEEAFFIYGEVFEDRTYARMGIRVQDGDTVWDVGKGPCCQEICRCCLLTLDVFGPVLEVASFFRSPTNSWMAYFLDCHNVSILQPKRAQCRGSNGVANGPF